jgi:hypothetical protein
MHRLEVENSVYKEKLEDNSALSQRGKLALIRALRKLEEANRLEIKQKLHANTLRLGKVTMIRQGTRFQEYWEDGIEMQTVKEQLTTVRNEKDRLDKLKR